MGVSQVHVSAIWEKLLKTGSPFSRGLTPACRVCVGREPGSDAEVSPVHHHVPRTGRCVHLSREPAVSLTAITRGLQRHPWKEVCAVCERIVSEKLS